MIRSIVLLVSSTFAFQLLAEDLRQELQRRSASEGLALIRISGAPTLLSSFSGGLPIIENPRGLSTAWIARGGGAVAWRLSYITTPLCASATILIEAPVGVEKWRVPDDVISTVIGVSPDGESVAFWGSRPPGSGQVNTEHSGKGWIRGLHYASKAAGVTTILQRPMPSTERPVQDFLVGSISWSADGKTFVYDDGGKIFIYEIMTKRLRQVASGSTPEWSPDGKWISFRSSSGYASAIDSITFAPHDLFGRRKIMRGIHWSPDSRYVMLSEQAGFLTELLHWWRDFGFIGEMLALRVGDGATVSVGSVYDPGIDDRNFSWVSDYRAFLKAASIQPATGSCAVY